MVYTGSHEFFYEMPFDIFILNTYVPQGSCDFLKTGLCHVHVNACIRKKESSDFLIPVTRRPEEGLLYLPDSEEERLGDQRK